MLHLIVEIPFSCRSRSVSESSSNALSGITEFELNTSKKRTMSLDVQDSRMFYIGSNDPSPAKEGVEYYIDEDIPEHTDGDYLCLCNIFFILLLRKM